MVYLSSFSLSDKKVKNPNLYPYSVFQDKDCDPFVFAPITILYGDNGCGKSTLLNIIAQKINAKGYETYAYGQYYIENYVEECRFDTGEDDNGRGNPSMCTFPWLSVYYSLSFAVYVGDTSGENL